MDKKREQLKPIGVFDSGVGGLTVLATAAKLLPQESFIYYGDSANAPYGSKSVEEVRELSLRAAQQLAERGCKALVIACNTATSAAATMLRELLPMPVVGMEPAVKPAVTHGGKILVMATPLTVRERKFLELCARCGTDNSNLLVLPCSGLVELVERGETDGAAAEAALRALFAGIDLAGVTAVVLGCTHYLYLWQTLSKVLPPGVTLVHGNRGTARQLARLLDADGLLNPGQAGGRGVEYLSSGGSDAVERMKQYYQFAEKMEGFL